MKKKTIPQSQLPDLPKIVRGIMKKKPMKPVELARKLGWVPSTVTALFKRRDWSVAELKMVGGALNHDLLQYLYPSPPEGMVSGALVEQLNKELSEAREQLKTRDEELLVLRTENKVLREVAKLPEK